MTTSGTSYAYIHCKPDGTPFYVGKGALRRAKYLGERNPHHQATVNKYGKANILIGMLECSTEDIAYELERGIIKCLRRQGAQLTNFTDGGEGASNPTPETRKRLSEAAKKRGVSEACHKARIIAKTGKPLSEQQKKKQSEAMRGIVFSDEHKKNISISAKKRGISDNVRQANIKAISKQVFGYHPQYGVKTWGSAKLTAMDLGTPISTTSKKIVSGKEYQGWILRYIP
jgi:hypothetical protein